MESSLIKLNLFVLTFKALAKYLIHSSESHFVGGVVEWRSFRSRQPIVKVTGMVCYGTGARLWIYGLYLEHVPRSKLRLITKIILSVLALMQNTHNHR